MKTLLLISDATSAYYDENGSLYFGNSFSPHVWQRYLKIADKIQFICRKSAKIYTEKEAKHQFQESPSDNIEVLFVSNPRESLSNYLSLKIKKKNRQIFKNAIKDSDLIIIRTLGSVNTSFVINEIKKDKKKYMCECIGDNFEAMWTYGLTGKLLAPKSYFDQRKLIKNASYVMYVTSIFLQKRYPTIGKNIGVSDVKINELTEKQKYECISRRRNLKNKNRIKLVTVGSLQDRSKGQKYVIKAIKILKEKGISNLEYHILGGGDKTKLESLAEKYGVSDKVIFDGQVKHEEVFNIIDKMDIFILSSLSEGLPRAIIEAMSRGLPCIGTNVGGIPELVSSKYLFTKNKNKISREIAQKIEILINKDSIEDEVKYSLQKASEFEKEKLDVKRRKFMKEFRDDILALN